MKTNETSSLQTIPQTIPQPIPQPMPQTIPQPIPQTMPCIMGSWQGSQHIMLTGFTTCSYSISNELVSVRELHRRPTGCLFVTYPRRAQWFSLGYGYVLYKYICGVLLCNGSAKVCPWASGFE